MAKKDKDSGKDKKKKTKPGEAARDMVPVVYARNVTEAELYKQLLTTNDIPAVIEDDAGETIGMPASIVGQGVPILVPDEMLSEASEIIAEHEDTEEDEELDEYEDVEEEGDEDLDDDEELDEDEEVEEEGEEKFDDDLDDDDMDDLDEVDEDDDER
jgi:hypothetical protein